MYPIQNCFLIPIKNNEDLRKEMEKRETKTLVKRLLKKLLEAN